MWNNSSRRWNYAHRERYPGYARFVTVFEMALQDWKESLALEEVETEVDLYQEETVSRPSCVNPATSSETGATESAGGKDQHSSSIEHPNGSLVQPFSMRTMPHEKLCRFPPAVTTGRLLLKDSNALAVDQPAVYCERPSKLRSHTDAASISEHSWTTAWISPSTRDSTRGIMAIASVLNSGNEAFL